MRKKIIITAYLISLAVLLIAVCIEILNVNAGGILPRTEYRNNNPEQGLVKWRQDPLTYEKIWIRIKGPQDENGTPINRPLTTIEKNQMEKDIKRASAYNTLHGFVSTAGLLQYILVLVLGVFSIVIMIRKPITAKQIITGIPPLFISILCGILMFYRAYFTSLGW